MKPIKTRPVTEAEIRALVIARTAASPNTPKKIEQAVKWVKDFQHS